MKFHSKICCEREYSWILSGKKQKDKLIVRKCKVDLPPKIQLRQCLTKDRLEDQRQFSYHPVRHVDKNICFRKDTCHDPCWNICNLWYSRLPCIRLWACAFPPSCRPSMYSDKQSPTVHDTRDRNVWFCCQIALTVSTFWYSWDRSSDCNLVEYRIFARDPISPLWPRNTRRTTCRDYAVSRTTAPYRPRALSRTPETKKMKNSICILEKKKILDDNKFDSHNVFAVAAITSKYNPLICAVACSLGILL